MSVSKTTFLETFRKALGRLMHLSMRSFWRYAREQGLSFTHVFALRHIHYKGQCNISDIGAGLGVSSAAASQMLDRLVGDGLISRREDPADRRNKVLSLTEEGERILQESASARQGWLDALFDQLSAQERQQVYAAAQILIEKIPPLEERS